MIAVGNRFRGRNSLRRVYSLGKVVRGQQCSLTYLLNDRRTKYRLAVVVSKKVSKSAVKRNRIRRRIYEVVRGFGLEKQSYDIVISVFADTFLSMPHEQLQKSIKNLFNSAGIISK